MPKCSGQCFEGRQSVFKEGGRADLKDAAMRPETHVFEGLTAAAYASFSVADVTRKIKNVLIKNSRYKLSCCNRCKNGSPRNVHADNSGRLP